MSSGTHKLDVDALVSQLAGAIRPPAKAVRPRDAYAKRATCRFRAVVDYALAQGQSFRSLARAAECTVRHLIDCYDGRRNVPAWMFDAMPADARAEGIRVEIEQLRKVS